MKNLTTTFNKVKSMLESQERYRNSDEALVVKYWWLEMAEMGLSEDITAKEFFFLYREGRFTEADQITRARRKVGEEFPSLRGLSYNPRKKNAEKYKEELRSLTSRGMTP